MDRRSPRRRPNRRESEATVADRERESEQVINSEGTGGAELRASEPEIRFPISFDVERCLEEGERWSISTDVVRDFRGERSTLQVEDIARDLLIRSCRAKKNGSSSIGLLWSLDGRSKR